MSDGKKQQQDRDEKRSQGQDAPRRGRTPTADDLAAAAEAVSKAAGVVSEALHGPVQGSPPAQLPAQGTATQAGYESFMAALEPYLRQAGDRVRTQEKAGWMKIEGVQSGERVYVSRAKREVHRITCTLPPEAVPGAKKPLVPNGLIKSHLPADPEAVGKAILKIAEPAK